MKDLYIDVGSTNLKWAESDNGALHLLAFPAPTIDKYPYYEVSCSGIVDSIKKIVCESGAQRAFISVQMHGYVLLKNGVAVTDYVSWRDERARDLTPAFKITKEYGVDVKPNLPRLSVQAQAVEFDELCTLGSFIAYSLTGNNATHITDGAASGFYNVKTGVADTVPFKLPAVRYGVQRIGEYCNTAIYTPVGDQQASVLGAVGCDYDGLILNLGTAGQMCCISNEFISGDYESRPFFGGKTLCTVTRLMGGGVIADGQDEDLLELLIKDYSAAKQKLPKKQEITVIGGVTKYRKKLLYKTLSGLGMRFVLNEHCNSLQGLRVLSKEVE